MKFILWLTLGLLLGPSVLSYEMPSIFNQISMVAGAIFLFFAGWELRLLDLYKDRMYYFKVFSAGTFLPMCMVYFVFSQDTFLAVALSISALPIAIQILKEKKLFNSLLARRTITLASLSDILAWTLLLIIFPKESLSQWLSSHWSILVFFIGIAVGRTKEFPYGSRVHFTQIWILAPLFFIGMGWNINFLSTFSWEIFVKIFTMALIVKLVFVYGASRWAKESHRFSLNIAGLLNSRGAMEILAANFAFKAGIIGASTLTALVMTAILTSIMASFLVNAPTDLS